MREASTSYQADDPADSELGCDARFRDLARGEQLMVWSLRAIALGHADCPALQRALQVALGSSAEEAFTALFVAVRTLGWCARRRLRLHVPGCDRVSEDERGLLALFSAAQTALVNGDEGEVRSRLEALIETSATAGLLMTLQTVTSALEVNGYSLPGRERATVRRQLH